MDFFSGILNSTIENSPLRQTNVGISFMLKSAYNKTQWQIVTGTEIRSYRQEQGPLHKLHFAHAIHYGIKKKSSKILYVFIN